MNQESNTAHRSDFNEVRQTFRDHFCTNHVDVTDLKPQMFFKEKLPETQACWFHDLRIAHSLHTFTVAQDILKAPTHSGADRIQGAPHISSKDWEL